MIATTAKSKKLRDHYHSNDDGTVTHNPTVVAAALVLAIVGVPILRRSSLVVAHGNPSRHKGERHHRPFSPQSRTINLPPV